MDKYEMRTFVQVNIALKIRSVTKRKLIPLHCVLRSIFPYPEITFFKYCIFRYSPEIFLYPFVSIFGRGFFCSSYDDKVY